MAQRVLDRLMNAIEGDDRLDRPGHRLEQGLAFAQNLLGVTRGRARGFLHGVWLGHPFHPLLTDIPIGAWTTALVLDLRGHERTARGGGARPRRSAGRGGDRPERLAVHA